MFTIPLNAGLFLGAQDNNKITDGYLKNCIVNGASGCEYGVYIGSSAGWCIDGLHLYGNTDLPLFLRNGFYTNISNIYIEKAVKRPISCLSTQANVNLNNLVIHQTNGDYEAIRVERSSYHPYNDANVTISNCSIIRSNTITNNAIVGSSVYILTSNVNLNAEGQDIKDYSSGCIRELKGVITSSNNNILIKDGSNNTLGNTRIHHRQGITNTTQIEIDLSNYVNWGQQFVHLTCIGAVYQTQTSKFFDGYIYLFNGNSTSSWIKTIQNDMFTSISSSFNATNKVLTITYEFNAANIYAIADYEVSF